MKIWFAALQLSIVVIAVSAANQDASLSGARPFDQETTVDFPIDKVCKYCKYCELCDKCPCTGMAGCEHCDQCQYCWMCSFCPKPGEEPVSIDRDSRIPRRKPLSESEIHLEYLVRTQLARPLRDGVVS
jgi:hypothetical protein